MTELMLETDNLTKFYGERCAVYQLNLKVPRGVVYGLLGPNGAGKSTTLRMITGCLKPTYGRIRVFGFTDRIKIMEKMGYLPEKPVAYSHMTAITFLVYMGRLAGLSKKEAVEKSRELLDFMGLGKLAYNKVGTFSAGERQRLGFAQALINNPEFLVLDEPTSNLDPVGRFDLLNRVRRLVEGKGVTVLTSSHVIPEVERISDDVGIINKGSLLVQGSISDLISKEEDEYVIEVSDSKILMERLKKENYVIDVRIGEDRSLFVKVDLDKAKAFWTALPMILSEEKIALYGFHPIGDPLERLFLRRLGVEK